MTRRTRPPGAWSGTENAFQKSAMNMVVMIAGTAGVDRSACMHIPSGAVLAGDEQQRKRQAQHLKAQGWRPGYPDIMVFAPKLVYITHKTYENTGIAIELKVFPNKPSDEQLHVHAILENAGWRIHVCYGMDEVTSAVKSYFGK
jgi:hypothetical protein